MGQLGLSIEEGIKQVHNGGGHVVILGAGASIASTNRNPELNGMKLPSMANFNTTLNLVEQLNKVPEFNPSENFEISYSRLHKIDPNSTLLKEIETEIHKYFSAMKLPVAPTIYDYLVLSLRNKDLIATFNWDPFLYQAWCRNQHFTKDLPNIAFLHGNVAIGYCNVNKRSGPAGMCLNSDGSGYFEPTKLLYPVDQKDYNSDEYIFREWQRVKYWLSKEYGAVRVTIFGYGAPSSDIEAMNLMETAWGGSSNRPMEQFEIIDVSSEAELRMRWKNFIHSHHYNVTNDYFRSSLALNPRRTSESYFNHYEPLTPQEAFRQPNPVPQDFKTLKDLWEWHKPLTEAESNIK